MPWSIEDAGDQRGKTMLVTGSNTGIGFATARLLARKSARVILACRNRQKAEEALARLKREIPTSDLHLTSLDLANLSSVRACASAILSEHQGLDVLINNAGLMMPPLSRTDDGFEMQFGTNVLGHFALTGLLLPLLDRTPHARVVWLGSVAHWDGRIAFDNLNAERSYGSWRAYAQSKLADIMLAYELERRLRRTASTTISLAAHPGGTRSELGRYHPALRVLSKLLAPVTQSAEGGALPSIRAAIAADACGGEFYGPSRMLTVLGPPTRQRSSRRSHDAAGAARLWRECERLSGVRYLDG